MLDLCLIYYVLAGAAAIIATSSSTCKIDEMKSASAEFVGDLALPSSQTQLLISTLEGDCNLAAFLDGHDYLESGLISLACHVAQAILGSESVDTEPVDQTEVMLNWYVVA